MKKILMSLFLILITSSSAFAGINDTKLFNLYLQKNDGRAIKSLLKSQVKYANKTDFDKFISTYDENFVNADGFDLKTYSNLVKDVWETYDKIVYSIKIDDIHINDKAAAVNVTESSYADISISPKMDGILRSKSNSIYYLKKNGKEWKVLSEDVVKEETSMLYGIAKKLDVTLIAPEKIAAGEEYTASLEFIPPEGIIAIASIASDKVTYPQEQPKEVYRRFPEDNILERLFISNKDNVNEYVVASIGLTKADIEDLSIKLSLAGFGYKIVRVNVVPSQEEANDVEAK